MKLTTSAVLGKTDDRELCNIGINIVNVFGRHLNSRKKHILLPNSPLPVVEIISIIILIVLTSVLSSLHVPLLIMSVCHVFLKYVSRNNENYSQNTVFKSISYGSNLDIP